ncbi:hypothetical protein C0J52_13881 [Blattella germanica]|nr:hypothetical protein C0J52_13881 [Blattella germanica]
MYGQQYFQIVYCKVEHDSTPVTASQQINMNNTIHEGGLTTPGSITNEAASKKRKILSCLKKTKSHIKKPVQFHNESRRYKYHREHVKSGKEILRQKNSNIRNESQKYFDAQMSASTPKLEKDSIECKLKMQRTAYVNDTIKSHNNANASKVLLQEKQSLDKLTVNGTPEIAQEFVSLNSGKSESVSLNSHCISNSPSIEVHTNSELKNIKKVKTGNIPSVGQNSAQISFEIKKDIVNSTTEFKPSVGNFIETSNSCGGSANIPLDSSSICFNSIKKTQSCLKKTKSHIKKHVKFNNEIQYYKYHQAHLKSVNKILRQKNFKIRNKNKKMSASALQIRQDCIECKLKMQRIESKLKMRRTAYVNGTIQSHNNANANKVLLQEQPSLDKLTVNGTQEFVSLNSGKGESVSLNSDCISISPSCEGSVIIPLDSSNINFNSSNTTMENSNIPKDCSRIEGIHCARLIPVELIISKHASTRKNTLCIDKRNPPENSLGNDRETLVSSNAAKHTLQIKRVPYVKLKRLTDAEIKEASKSSLKQKMNMSPTDEMMHIPAKKERIRTPTVKFLEYVASYDFNTKSEGRNKHKHLNEPNINKSDIMVEEISESKPTRQINTFPPREVVLTRHRDLEISESKPIKQINTLPQCKISETKPIKQINTLPQCKVVLKRLSPSFINSFTKRNETIQSADDGDWRGWDVNILPLPRCDVYTISDGDMISRVIILKDC